MLPKLNSTWCWLVMQQIEGKVNEFHNKSEQAAFTVWWSAASDWISESVRKMSVCLRQPHPCRLRVCEWGEMLSFLMQMHSHGLRQRFTSATQICCFFVLKKSHNSLRKEDMSADTHHMTCGCTNTRRGWRDSSFLSSSVFLKDLLWKWYWNSPLKNSHLCCIRFFNAAAGEW